MGRPRPLGVGSVQSGQLTLPLCNWHYLGDVLGDFFLGAVSKMRMNRRCKKISSGAAHDRRSPTLNSTVWTSSGRKTLYAFLIYCPFRISISWCFAWLYVPVDDPVLRGAPPPRPAPQKLSGWQRVMGTPTVQYFHEGRQVGENVEELSYPTFMDHGRGSAGGAGARVGYRIGSVTLPKPLTDTALRSSFRVVLPFPSLQRWGPPTEVLEAEPLRLSSRQRPSSTSDLSQLHTPSSTTQPCPVSGWRTPRPTPALGVHFLPAADRAVAPLPAAVIGPVPCHRSRLFSQRLREPHLFGSSLWHKHVQCESSFVPAPCLHFVSVWFYCGLPFQ